MTIRKLPGSQIESNTITITQIQTTAVTNIVTQAGPRVSSLIYPGNDTAANTVGGQTVYINGSGFETNNAIYINGNAVPSKSFISASNLSFTTPALAAGIYPVYVINTDSGATAIFVPGYISSAEPAWVTGSSLSEVGATEAWNISLSATGDAPVTYALAAGSSLPSGISLAANGLISGTLSSPPENDTQYTFTVVATDAQNQDASRQFTITTSVGEGVLFANNVLLIHADGTNNQNNHHFIDLSSNNYTITRNGNPYQGSFSPFSQTGWSVYFGSSTSNLILPSNSSFAIAAGNFTIEGFANFTAWSGTNQRIFLQGVNGTDGIALYRNSGANNLIVGINNTEVISYSWNPVLGKWYHLAVVRSGTGSNQVALYIDGVSVATGTGNASVAQNQFIIGGLNWASSYNMQGYISNVRYSNNARTVVVPTSAYTSDANTIALACQSNRFVDNSNNNFSITVNGTTSVVPFSPFAPTAVYSTANVGGSGYFDGTGDYLNAPSSIWTSLAGTSTSFTVEAWIYPTAISAQASEIIGINQSGQTSAVSFRLTTAYALTFGNWGSGYTSTTSADGVVRPYAWNHVAASKSGSTMRLFVNGTIVASQTISDGTLNSFSKQLEIGGRSDDNATKFIGYMSSLRVVQGEALYTANTSPPTAPPTNVANTSLLINFTNAGIFDQTAKTVLETVGDAKVSTAQYKYGTGSIAFDGTGDYLEFPRTPNLQFGGGDFTAEAWVYLTTSSAATIFWIEGTNSASGFASLRVGADSGQLYVLISTNNSSWAVQSGLVGTSIVNQWVHVAVTRSGNNVRLFRNGTQIGTTYTLSGSVMTGTYNRIGYLFSGEPWVGYIDDLRITRGYARYTSNFTAPTAALRDK